MACAPAASSTARQLQGRSSSAKGASGPTPDGIGGNWALKFDDEFNGNSLDLGKWTPNWLASTSSAITNPVNSHEVACYDPALVREQGASLRIDAVAERCVADTGAKYNFASGIIQSHDHFRFRYGVLEARIWLPAGVQNTQDLPAFWADGTGTWPTTGEIDVMEVLGGRLCWHFHRSGGVAGSCYTPMVGGWHVYAADWEPGRITYYYDGVKIGSVTVGVTSAPMYLIVSLGLSSSLAGAAPTPSSMKVDYVRVWQHRKG